MDPYEVLMLDATSSTGDVGAAYRRLVMHIQRSVGRFGAQSCATRLLQLDRAYKRLMPMIPTFASAVSGGMMADYLECQIDAIFLKIVEPIDGLLSDLSECPDWRGEGCS